MSAHLHLIYREFRHRQLLGNLTGNVHRSRHALNADTIREMHLRSVEVAGRLDGGWDLRGHGLERAPMMTRALD